MPSLSNYERRRLVNIQRNNERLKQLGLHEFNLQPPSKQTKKKRKALEIETGISTPRKQPHRSAKKKLSNGELSEQLEQIQENDDTVFQPLRRYSKRIQENRRTERSMTVDSEDDQDEYKDIPSKLMFQPDTAMEMSDVKTRLVEIGTVTPTQVALRGFSVRLAEKSDLSASTKKELQQQVLHLCKYGMLARWVLKDDGESRVLEIVRCSGIEGHHPSSLSSWANEKSNPRVRNHALYNNGPKKKDSCFKIGQTWLFKMCSRDRAGPVDRAPLVHGVQQNVECLMAAYNRCHLAFGAPIRDNMNGEIKLIQCVLGLNTQDGIDKILNTPIINDGSNGKLVLLIITIEEPSTLKPVLHATSSRKKKSTFMAAKNKTLAGNRTSDQSRALDKMIYRMQKANYDKGLGSRTKEQKRANCLLGYQKSLALLTYEQRRANRLSHGQWMGMYQKLVAYKKQYKSTQLPSRYTKDTPLGRWIAKQRFLYNKNKLESKRTELLNSINFVWSMRSFVGIPLDVHWMGMYQKLVAYKKQYKSTQVPSRYTKDPPLGIWVAKQRFWYNKNKLANKRTELLNSINFNFLRNYGHRRYDETHSNINSNSNSNSNK